MNGLYVLTPSLSAQLNTNSQNDDRSYKSNNNCLDSQYKESMIMECSDQSMLKLQFGKCTNMPSKSYLFINSTLFLIIFI